MRLNRALMVKFLLSFDAGRSMPRIDVTHHNIAYRALMTVNAGTPWRGRQGGRRWRDYNQRRQHEAVSLILSNRVLL